MGSAVGGLRRHTGWRGDVINRVNRQRAALFVRHDGQAGVGHQPGECIVRQIETAYRRRADAADGFGDVIRHHLRAKPPLQPGAQHWFVHLHLHLLGKPTGKFGIGRGHDPSRQREDEKNFKPVRVDTPGP